MVTHSCLLFRECQHAELPLFILYPFYRRQGMSTRYRCEGPSRFTGSMQKGEFSIADIGGGEDAMEEKIVKSSQVKSKRAGPKAAPLGRKQT